MQGTILYDLNRKSKIKLTKQFTEKNHVDVYIKKKSVKILNISLTNNED